MALKIPAYHTIHPLFINSPSFEALEIFITAKASKKLGDMCALSLIERWRTRKDLY